MGSDVVVMEEVMGIMQKALQPPASPKLAADARVARPARIAFRDALLGVSLPDLLG